MAKTKAKAKTKQKAQTTMKANPNDLRKEVKQKLEAINEHWYDVSLAFHRIRSEELFRLWGYKSFREYVKGEDLGLEYRIAAYRANIGAEIERLGITKDAVKDMGWTKFREITKLLDEETSAEEIRQVFSKVKELSVRETQEYVKAKQMEGEGTPTGPETLSFRLKGDSAAVIKEALALAKKLAPETEDSDTAAITYICLEWMSNYNPELAKHIRQVTSDVVKEKKAEPGPDEAPKKGKKTEGKKKSKKKGGSQ